MAEHLPKRPNPRVVITSLTAAEIDARSLYEDLYCVRGNPCRRQPRGGWPDGPAL
jgi:hypothetical protein